MAPIVERKNLDVYSYWKNVYHGAMDTVTATAGDLILVLEEAGTAFGWSRAYESVLSTAIGAAFQAAGLDEATDAIGVSPADVKKVTAAITESAASLGRAPRTVTAYGAAWRRIAEITYRWKTAGGQDPGGSFWESVDDLRDQRTRRLTAKKTTPHALYADPGREAHDALRVDLSSGQATITLPDDMADEDFMVLVEAILARRRAAGRD
jgi:hypothetical protein